MLQHFEYNGFSIKILHFKNNCILFYFFEELDKMKF